MLSLSAAEVRQRLGFYSPSSVSSVSSYHRPVVFVPKFPELLGSCRHKSLEGIESKNVFATEILDQNTVSRVSVFPLDLLALDDDRGAKRIPSRAARGHAPLQYVIHVGTFLSFA